MSGNFFGRVALTYQFRQGLDANIVKSTTYFQQGEPGYTTDTKQLFIADGSNNKNPVGGPRINLAATVANITASVPAGYCIDDVFLQETAGHAVTGGIKIGTTNGGTEIATAITVGANSFTRTVPSALTTSGPFSPTVATTIYIQAVTGWNSASVNIIIPLKRAIK